MKSALKIINIKDNYQTHESLRHVWLLLELNRDIILDITEPSIFNWGAINPANPKEKKVMNKFRMIKDRYEKEKPKDKKARLIKEEIIRNENAHGVKLFCRKVARKCCCFKDFNDEFGNEEAPSCKKTCCWRFLHSRQKAYMYKTSKKIRQEQETKTSRCLSYTLAINFGIHITAMLIPFIFMLDMSIRPQR